MSKNKLDFNGLDTLTTMIKNHVDNKISISKQYTDDKIEIGVPIGVI